MRSINRRVLLALALAPLMLTGCAIPSLKSMSDAGAPPPGVVAMPKPVKSEPAVSPESRQLYEQALAALKAHRFAEAERALLVVTQREPELAGPHANLGILYVHTGKPAQAIESLRRAIRLNPDRAAYHNELGMVFRRQGKFDDARRSYADALEADPGYAYAHLNIGILYDLYLQDPAKALPHYQRYRELAPTEGATVTKWIADLQQRARAVERKDGMSEKGG